MCANKSVLWYLIYGCCNKLVVSNLSVLTIVKLLRGVIDSKIGTNHTGLVVYIVIKNMIKALNV